MKWIMIIIVCIGADCQQFTPEKLFDSYEECQVGAGIMKQYYMETLPESYGEIHCMEFEMEANPTGLPI